MLKFLFWTLLLGNVVVFAYHQGFMDAVAPDGREPGRAARQLNADKLRLVPAPAAPAAQPQQAAVADKAPELIACTEIGNFDAAEARRFEARIASLALGDRLSQRQVSEDLRHIVFIPPQGSKEGADKKAAELRRLGISDFYVIQDGAELRWGISLGIFRTEDAARAQLAALGQKGVRSARIGPYGASPARLAFQLRGLDARTKAELDGIGKEFPQQQQRSCGSV